MAINRALPINLDARRLELCIFGLITKYEEEYGVSVISAEVEKHEGYPIGATKRVAIMAAVPEYYEEPPPEREPDFEAQYHEDQYCRFHPLDDDSSPFYYHGSRD